MKMRLLSPLLLIGASALAAETAEALMATATAKAAASNRNVLAVFHASWCGWCKRFESMLADVQAGPVMNKYFVVARIDVLEDKDKADLNTPGGTELMAAAGGKGQSLPFYAMLDANGKLIVNSLRQPGSTNAGYPSEPEEIDWFMTMLQRSAPALSHAEAATLKGWLQAHAR